LTSQADAWHSAQAPRFAKCDVLVLLLLLMLLPPQTWQIHPGKLLMVGDSHEDVECGNAAGTATCLIAGGGNEVGEYAQPAHLWGQFVCVHGVLATSCTFNVCSRL
jgi:ribonucleotide monophosphatase NagD (HAD superfamily)